MSGFDLVRVDAGGGSPIRLPPGETVLGRGPLLGVSDKRVSRLHGLLQNLNGELRLKPTHLNPCFVQASPTDDPRPLQRNSWHPLRHGDLFSLLPGQVIFQVEAVGGEGRTPSRLFDEGELPVDPEPEVESPPPVGVTPPSAAAPPEQQQQQQQQEEEEEAASRSSDQRGSARPNGVQSRCGDASPSVSRRRVLPAWMMAAVATAPSGSSSSSCSPKVTAVKRSRGPSTGTKPAAAKQATPTKASSPEEAQLSEEEMPRKRRRNMIDEEEESAGSKTRPVGLRNEPERSEVCDEGGGFPAEEAEPEEGGESPPADAAGRSESEDGKQKNVRPRLRAPCAYGSSCYRKNPAHFQECSHPGDPDYEQEEQEEQEEEAERPECPYGTACYRKNPLHRKEYKHTERPARATRTAPGSAPADSDEDEYEDSFIDDDSEDAGDDSDYTPPASEDSGREDVAALRDEAKAFTRRRK
ncbi:aprataxin and PNK-like factor isoform 2-T3 [Spinachia spinachia]